MPNRHSPGCRCCGSTTPACPGPVPLEVTYTACQGQLDFRGSGMAVTVTRPDGTTAQPTITYQVFSNPNGPTTYSARWGISATQAGDYTATVTSGVTVTSTRTFNLPNLCTGRGFNITLTNSKLRVYAQGCGNAPGTPAANGNLNVFVAVQGGGFSASGVTDSTGYADLDITSEWDLQPTVTYSFSKSHWKPVSYTGLLTCFANATMEPEACYHCLEAPAGQQCHEAAKLTGTLTTPFGSICLGCDWKGQATFQVTGWGYTYFPPPGAGYASDCNLPPKTTTSVPVTFNAYLTYSPLGYEINIGAAACKCAFASDLPAGATYGNLGPGAVAVRVPITGFNCPSPEGCATLSGSYTAPLKPDGTPDCIASHFNGSYSFSSCGGSCGDPYSNPYGVDAETMQAMGYADDEAATDGDGNLFMVE